MATRVGAPRAMLAGSLVVLAASLVFHWALRHVEREAPPGAPLGAAADEGAA